LGQIEPGRERRTGTSQHQHPHRARERVDRPSQPQPGFRGLRVALVGTIQRDRGNVAGF
jgi:hypothetical protein